MPETFSTRYAALIAAGKIEADPGAGAARGAADRARTAGSIEHRLARKSSSLGWLFGRASRPARR